MKPTRRTFIVAAASAGALVLPRTASARHKSKTSDPLVLNDASKLNPVRVARHAVVQSGRDEELIESLRALLREARDEGRPVCAGGARHSMGGQSLVRDGVAASFEAPAVEADQSHKRYRVRAGARWRDVISALDPLGLSPAVMQSNHDFSVAGTLCVNAHGWPVPYGPFGSTVRSFRLMLADGTVVTCSPTENTELFNLAVGGYGLFGIVIDIELDAAENALLNAQYDVMSSEDFAARFTAVAIEPGVRMAYGRLSVAREDYLDEALLVSYRPAESQPATLPPPGVSGFFSTVSRSIFRAQTGSESAKLRRWFLESVVAPRAMPERGLTRNTLLNYPVAALADSDQRRTDILHEYFVDPERLEDFLEACRQIIPRFRQDLLNVTLRYVEAYPSSVLTFAPQRRIAAVMLFPQRMTAEGEEQMRALTEALIDRVLALGGSYYLPYRLHARGDQLRKAYPRVEEFVAKKRSYDPQLRFRNMMWEKYFG